MVSQYQEAIRDLFARASVVPKKRKRFVLLELDVSGSMATAYNSPSARLSLKHLVGLPWVKVFCFNDGLLTADDCESEIHPRGGSNLSAALKQLFEMPEAGIPDRLLLVTDGEYDDPEQLLKNVPSRIECVPDDVSCHLDWLVDRHSTG